MLFSSIVLLALFQAIAAFDINLKSNVAVYWGQNSAGGATTQQQLSYYCESDDVDIVLLSFLSSYPALGLNLANACETTFEGSTLLSCPNVAADIQTCQNNGKIVLLSMGGALGNYGFSSDSEAEAFATTLWNTFGAGTTAQRPFGSAILDGYDLDLENHNQVGTVAFSKKLRELFATDSSRNYYLSTAPQCPFPDQSVGDVLSQVEVDFAFIQFYNNYCLLGSQFNFDTWQTYAQSAPNPNIKLYLGLAGAPSAAGSGYVPSSTVQQYVSQIENSANFGGISLWDASQAWANSNFAGQMKDILPKDTSSSPSLDKAASSSTVTSTTKITTTLGQATTPATPTPATPTTSTTPTTSSTPTTTVTPTTSSTPTTTVTPTTSSTPTTTATPTTTTSATTSATTSSTTSSTTISSTTTSATTEDATSTTTPTTTTSTSSTAPTPTTVAPTLASFDPSSLATEEASSPATFEASSETVVTTPNAASEAPNKTSFVVTYETEAAVHHTVTAFAYTTMITTFYTPPITIAA